MASKTWHRFIEGNDSAFDELYSQYFKGLFAYGTKLGFDNDSCKDAIQDIFFTIYTSRNKLKHIKNLEFYLLRCLKNKLFDFHSNQMQLDNFNENDMLLPDNNPTIIEEIIQEEKQVLLKEKLNRILNILSPKQKKIIYYYYNLELDYNEIALILNNSPESIKKTLYRSLKKCKQSV